MYGSSSVKDAETKGIRFARDAIHHDNNNDIEAALSSYREAIHYLLIARDEGSCLPNLTAKIEDYVSRAEILSKALQEKDNPEATGTNNNVKRKSSGLLGRVQFLLNQALEEDSTGNHENAIEMYLDAVEICVKARDSIEDEQTKVKLSKLAQDAISRAEELSSLTKCDSLNEARKDLEKLNLQVDQVNNRPGSPSPAKDQYGTCRSSLSEKKLNVVGQAGYTKDELSVIRKTSVINGVEYLPFLAIDLKEKFAFPLPFTDKIGFLPLSSKQQRCFHRWVRLEDLCSEPQIIKEIDCFSVKQTLVSDCSFIASLTVAALYEKRFKKRLITNIIYPQNRNRQPVYNPCGKYMIKLHINGLDRKVIIDDFFPVDINNGLLCSHSVNHDEFWVSILEKAYVKVMGGYDFPGSNSSIDLNALTGWIPERLTTKESLSKMYRPLLERYHRGDVLLTVATGDLSEFDQERSGLVPNHAYAVLDLREVDGQRLMLLKNPWRHLSWKGNFSDSDNVNWTSSLKQKLNYDPRSARNHDIGVFWIDVKSLIHFFDTVYLNWKCSLFKYTFCTHGCWLAGVGPAKDLYNIGENPQFLLDVKNDNTSVWVLLTRHIVDKKDFAQNQEFITLVVYKGSEKIYLPFDPPPFIDGVRINSPHYLCKINIPEGGSTKYVLVISQYEKSTTIYYTIRVYANSLFSFKKLTDHYQFTEKITNGSWDEQTAGGCPNHQLTYHLNPVYLLEVNGSDEMSNELLIDLKGPKQYSVGFDVRTVTSRNPNSPNNFNRISSGAYRSGFTILKLKKVPPGTYHIIPSTFDPGQKGPFFLTIKSTCPFKVTRIK